MLSINKNKIFYKKNVYEFNYDVLEAEIINDKIVVVFEPNNPSCMKDNVFCFSLKKELLWRIKKPSKELAGTSQYPYVGIYLSDLNFGVVDFFGRRFFVNLDNGEIVGKDILK